MGCKYCGKTVAVPKAFLDGLRPSYAVCKTCMPLHTGVEGYLPKGLTKGDLEKFSAVAEALNATAQALDVMEKP